MMNGLRRRLRTQPEELQKLLGGIEGSFRVHVDHFKRLPVPEGVPAELTDWYRAKSFYFEKDIKDFTVIKSPALAQEIAKGYTELTELFKYFDSLEPEEDMN